LLPQYKAAPEITKDRLYIETMEKILAKTQKVIVNDKSGNLLVLPLEQLLKNKNEQSSESTTANSDSDYNINLPNPLDAENAQQNGVEAENHSSTTTNNNSNNRTRRTMGR